MLYKDRNTRLLLQCIQSKAVLRMWAGLEVHTDKSIPAGRCELAKFSSLMAVSNLAIFEQIFVWFNLDQEYSKAISIKFDFPKMHWYKHLFDDIEAKGPTRHFNTKPNEKLHGPLKKAYSDSNGKDFSSQVSTCNIAEGL